MGDDNVFQFGALDGGKDAKKEIPQDDYIVKDVWGQTYFAHGFMIFTSEHVAIMKETDAGAIPVLLMPLTQVNIIFIDDEELVAEVEEDEEVA